MRMRNGNMSERLFHMGAVTVIVLGLYLSSLHGYILFHSLVEISTVAVGFTLFILAWNARWFLKNNYLNILGIGYAFISLIDMLHTLAYKGMNVFPGHGANLPTQLWIAARYLQAVTLCAAPLFAERAVDRRVIFAGYAAAVSALMAMVYSGNFPACYIEGKGLTAFKIGSEFVTIALLLISSYLLYRKRRYFNNRVFSLMVSSIACAIVSGISFTAYLNVYDFANMVGHYFKLASFYLLYRALLVTGLREPFDLVFRELRQAQEAIRNAHDTLEEQVMERTAELRESEARYRSLFEESIDGVFLSSVEGTIIDINLTGVRIFGYDSKEEMAGLDLARDVYANTEERNRFISVIDKKGSGEYEAVLKKKNGGTMLARLSMAVIRNYDGNVIGYQGVIRDVTEERRLERELFKAKKMEIIGQLAGGVAHEVRNPLNAILSISEALFREEEIADNPEFVPYLQHMRAQVGRLSKLMSDLLDLGKPVKPANIHTVSLHEVCASSVDLWKMTEAANAHSVTFACDDAATEPWVNADSERLQQVFLNLMDNAAQHSSEGAGIVITTERTDERTVAVRVRDEGKGIAPEKIERVFDPFFTTRSGGTGLGLALVKHFIESMGGAARIFNNEPPPGCTAELLLSITDQGGNAEGETENTFN
jgi:PAS domain S-box-containing protein